MSPNQIENGRQTLAIGSSSAPQPEFLEKLERQRQGAKLNYYLWLSRFFIVMATLSLLLLISSALALFRLAPMVTVEPFLIINQDSSEGIVRSEPITMDMPSRDKMMKTFIRQYIILRNTVINDPTEMRSRWMPGGMVNYMSSEDVYLAFNKSAASNWEEMFKRSLVREVEIISINRQGGAKSQVWKVDFKTYDLYDEQGRSQSQKESTLRARYWTASVTGHFIRERMFIGRRLINPLGFTVVRYSQTEVEIF